MKLKLITEIGVASSGYTFNKDNPIQEVTQEVGEYLLNTFPNKFEEVIVKKEMPKRKAKEVITKDA